MNTSITKPEREGLVEHFYRPNAATLAAKFPTADRKVILADMKQSFPERGWTREMIASQHHKFCLAYCRTGSVGAYLTTNKWVVPPDTNDVA